MGVMQVSVIELLIPALGRETAGWEPSPGAPCGISGLVNDTFYPRADREPAGWKGRS